MKQRKRDGMVGYVSKHPKGNAALKDSLSDNPESKKSWVTIEDHGMKSYGPPRRVPKRLSEPKANLEHAKKGLRNSWWDLLTDKERREYLEKRAKSLDNKRGVVIQ